MSTRRRIVAAALATLLAAPFSGCILLGTIDKHGEKRLDDGRPVVGAWLGSWPGDDNPAVDAFAAKTGVTPDLVDVYLDWRTPAANVTHTLQHIVSRGAVPILTWEAQTLTTVDILAGTKQLTLRDGRRLALGAYLDEFAAGICDAMRPTQSVVLVRVLHEMNGFWFAWGISWEDGKHNRPNTLENYKAAWIKIHDAFTSRCGATVQFVWAVNHYSLGPNTSFTNAYPGDAYVDYMGIDGYNWGSNADWGWQSFDTLFKPGYCALIGLSSKPILVAEVASSERGGDKAAWLRDLYARLPVYHRVQGFVYLDDAKYEVQIHGDMDWNVDSSPGALEAFAAGAHAMQASGPRASGPGPGC